MFNNDVEQLKEFLLWAKAHQIQHVKVDNIEVLFSGVAMVTSGPYEDEFTPRPAKNGEEKDSGKTMVDDLTSDMSDEELLMWSASR